MSTSPGEAYLCTTCGVQFPASEQPSAQCPICEDERQHVGADGQQWTTLDELRRAHRNVLTTEEPGLVSIRTEPIFAIGQRALLVETSEGSVLWDCVSLVDDATIAALRDRGGVSAIAISHPHFYATMVEWSRALGGVRSGSTRTTGSGSCDPIRWYGLGRRPRNASCGQTPSAAWSGPSRDISARCEESTTWSRGE